MAHCKRALPYKGKAVLAILPIRPVWAPLFSVNTKSSLDFGLGYENWSKHGSSLGLMGLRIAYAFGL
jgi:hypothetical protein